MYSHILIATDGSELAEKGVTHGLALAKAIGAKVTAVVVTEPFFGKTFPEEIELLGYATPEGIKRASEAAAARILNAVRDQAATSAIPFQMVHVYDRFPPADGILDTASERGCDLIVMASHGRRGLQRFFLGSQALEVVSRAKVPVLVVR